MLKRNDIQKVRESLQELERISGTLDGLLKKANSIQKDLTEQCQTDEDLSYLLKKEGRFFQDIQNRFRAWNLPTLMKRSLLDVEETIIRH